MTDIDVFQTYRPMLFGIAYRMLGSASEAEDVLQDAYLRYNAVETRAGAGPRDEIRSPKAYFSTIVTRLCLDRLKSARAEREQYLGIWLPEPILTPDGDADLQRHVERHESISLAFLVLLEALTPQERAVFLLREVFEYEYAEIAAILAISVANCRQLAHRAKQRVDEDRPRFPISSERQQQLVAGFLAATQHGDLQSLTQMLARDVIFWADSGGTGPAPVHPVYGREKVARLMIAINLRVPAVAGATVAEIRISSAIVNGESALLLWVRDQLDTVLVLSVTDQQIDGIRVMRNPAKLAYLRHQAESNPKQILFPA
ncbi:MAG: RNA polymerase sigma-70 factor [Roseiflexaceae bacterium]